MASTPPRSRPKAPACPLPEHDDSVALHHDEPSRRHARQDKLRVIKTIAPEQRGARRLALVYGEQLVCIRHRIDPTGRVRLTTVEVVVSAARIQPRPSPTILVALPPQAHGLRHRVIAAGGRWDPVEKAWRLRRATAIALGLRSRIRT